MGGLRSLRGKAGTETLKAGPGAEVLRIPAEKYGVEFFTLEAREPDAFNEISPRGMLISHVDLGQVHNDDESHRFLDIEEAAGTERLDKPVSYTSEMAGDVFPGVGGWTDFTPDTLPGSTAYLKKSSTGVRITGIARDYRTGVVSFDWTKKTGAQYDHIASTWKMGWSWIWGHGIGQYIGNTKRAAWLDGIEFHLDGEMGEVQISVYREMTGIAGAGLIRRSGPQAVVNGRNRLMFKKTDPGGG